MQIYNLYTANMFVEPNNFPKCMIYHIFNSNCVCYQKIGKLGIAKRN